MALSPQVIAALSIMYTGRGVSASDLNWWATTGASITYEQAVVLFAESPLTKIKYPFFQAPQTANKRQYISQVFATLYNIDINDTSLVPAEELAYWENWLALDPNNYLDFPNALNNASAVAGLNNRIEALTNKADVSLSFAEAFSSVGVNSLTPEQYADSTAIIAGVDEIPGSVLAAEAQIIELAAGVNVFTIAQAQAAPSLPPLYTISDSADNLIAGTANPVVVDATTVIANQSPAAPLTVANAEILLATADSLAPGVTWDILDSATDVLSGGVAVSGAASVGITDAFVDVATASDLTALGNFDDIYAIVDTSAAILANTGIAAGATSVTLSDPGVPVTVAQANTLQGLGNFGGPYNIVDTSAAILGAAGSPAVLGADSVTLSNPLAPVTVAGAETLQGLGNFAGAYNIADTSANILAAETSPALLGADSVILSNPSVPVTVANALVLQGLGNFGGPYNVVDTSANILAAAATPAVINATSVTLSDPGVAITVAGAQTFQDLGNFVGPYNITDTSANILAAATSPAVLGADSVTLSNPLTGITVAGAETLQGLGNFEGPYNILDTSANILAAATSPAVLGATSVTLSNSSVPVTVADAQTLQGLGNFEGPYAIEDTSANILAAATAPAVLGATSVTLSDPAVPVTVASAKTLQELGNFGGPYNIEDTSAAILGNATSPAVLDAESVILSNPGVPVSVAGAQTLQGLGNFEGPYHIEDTSANILAAATTPAVLNATSVELSNPGVPVTVDGAETLQGLGNFVGPYNIADTSANILAASTSPAVLDADSVTLSNPGVPVTVAGAETLQGLGNFVGAYNITDTSANILAASASGAVLDADSVSLSNPGVPVDVVGAVTLQDLGNFVGPYNIQDTSATILFAALLPAVLDADSVSLSDPGVPLSVADADTLQGLGNFVGPYHITDTSVAILAAATTPAVLNATSVELSDPGVPVTVAGANTLQGLGNFGGPYNVLDTSANILAAAGSAGVLGADTVELSNPGVPVTVAGAETLQGLGNFIGNYAIADTLANLTNADAGLLAGADFYTLTNPVPPGNLGVITQAQEIIVLGATNAADFSFIVADAVLTPQIDTFQANSFLSVAVAEGGSIFNTLNTGDSLTGTGVDPTLSVTWQKDTSGIDTVLPVMKGVETLVATLVGNDLNIQSNDFEIPGFGFITGLKNVLVSASTGDLNMTNLQTALETISVARYFNNNDVTFTIADAAIDAFNAADGQLDITLNQILGDGKGGNNTSINVSNFSGTGGYKNLGLETGGAASTVEIDGILGVENIEITGDKNLTIADSLISDTTFVDASTFTGDLDLFVDTSGGDLIILSGSGDDKIAVSRTAVNDPVSDPPFEDTAGHFIDGGDGDDTIGIFANADATIGGFTNAGHTVLGGDGKDTIGVFGDASGDFAGHVVDTGDGVENFVDIFGNANGISDAGHTVIGGTGIDDIFIIADASGDLAGHIVDTGDGVENFVDIFGNANGISDGGHEVDGGTGNDSISIFGSATGDLAGHIVNTGDGTNSVDIIGDALGGVDGGHTVIGGTGVDDIFIDGDVFGDLAGHIVDTGDGAENFVEIIGDAFGFVDAGHEVDGGAGDDDIKITGGAFADGAIAGHIVNTGAGDDTVTIMGDAIAGISFALGIRAGHTVNGGAGKDTITIMGDTKITNPDPVLLSLSGHVVTVENVSNTIVIEGDAIGVAGVDRVGHSVTGSAGVDDIKITGDAIGGITNGHFIVGNAGDDVVEIIGLGNHSVDGGEGSDSIVIDGNGNHSVVGGIGNDNVTITGKGSSFVDGGDGNDSITIEGTGGTGNNTVLGGLGIDTVNIFGNGNNKVDVGAANDVVNIVGDGNNTVIGGIGNDLVNIVGGGNNTVDVGDGDDIVNITGDGDNDVFAEEGNNLININGTGFNEVTIVGDGSNTVNGGDGKDIITILGGALALANVVNAGDGDDTVSITGDGNNSVTGALGKDTITITGNGNNVVFGDFGNFVDPVGGDDIIAIFGNGNNLVEADGGNDTVSIFGDGNNFAGGGEGNDTINIIGAGNNDANGDAGNDSITVVGDGDNTVFGVDGNDILTVVGDGSSTLSGGNGDDALQVAGGVVGIGQFTLTGGAGLDTFIVNDGATALIADLANGSALEVLQVLPGGTANATVVANWTPNLNTFNSGIANLEVADGVGGLTINLSGAFFDGTTKGFSVLGNTGNDVIIGGDDNDSITGGAGNDSITGGFGADDIILGNEGPGPGSNGDNRLFYGGGFAQNRSNNFGNMDFITGFNTANDGFVFQAGANNFLNGVNLVTGVSGIFGVRTTFSITERFVAADSLEQVVNLANVGASTFTNLGGFGNFANLQIADITVTGGALDGNRYLFANDNIAAGSTVNDFLADITTTTGNFTSANFSLFT